MSYTSGNQPMKKPPEKQKRKNRTLREFLKIYGFGFFVATLILVIAYQFVAPAPPKKMTVATASSGGAYFAFASEYKKHLAKERAKKRKEAFAARYEPR